MYSQIEQKRRVKFHGTASILVRQSATTSAGANTWILWNKGGAATSTVTQTNIYVTKIQYSLSFDGSGAATLMRYQWVRGTGVTSISGGTTVVPARFNTPLGAAVAFDSQVLDTGVTVNGITNIQALHTSTWVRTTPSATQAGGVGDFYILDYTYSPIILLPGEALVLNNGPTNTSVVGDTVLGSVEFFEQEYAKPIGG